jgi:hypothetical protein
VARPKPTALGLHCFNASIAGCRWKPYRIGKKCLWRYFFDDRREHRGRGGAGSLQGILRERLSETLARKVVELVIAEMMSSYRSQVQPPSRAVQ